MSARASIPQQEYRAIQAALMKRGRPGDACGACGCKRDQHTPHYTFSYAKSGGSSGKSVEIPTLAPTSCDCKFCICFCVAFMEPYKGQPYKQCVYAKKKPVQTPARAGR